MNVNKKILLPVLGVSAYLGGLALVLASYSLVHPFFWMGEILVAASGILLIDYEYRRK